MQLHTTVIVDRKSIEAITAALLRS